MTNPETTGTAVAVANPNAKGAMAKLLEPRAETLAALLPKGLEVSRVIAAAQLAAYQNPDLLKCDPASIFLAVGRIAQWGLEVGTTAHLVPFGGKVTPVADYKGLIELVIRSKAARTVYGEVVREGDTFDVEMGTTPRIVHKPAFRKDAPITHVYAVANHGALVPPQFVVMTVAEVEAIRTKHSKQWKSGPLPAWYAVKTVVRQLCKMLPKNPALASALSRIESEDEEIVDIDTGEVTTRRPLSALEGEPGDGRPRIPAPIQSNGYEFEEDQ